MAVTKETDMMIGMLRRSVVTALWTATLLLLFRPGLSAEASPTDGADGRLA